MDALSEKTVKPEQHGVQHSSTVFVVGQGEKMATAIKPQATQDCKNKDGQLKLSKDPTMNESQILKNVLLISVSFFFLFTCYGGLAALQSSLHIQEGMGVINQSVLYGFMCFSALFLARPVISALGHKWSLVLGMTGYILWMGANGYAVWGTMVTASILLGLCASVLWTAQCGYFAVAAQRYADMRGESLDSVNARFFGIFFAIFRLSGAASGLIQTLILQQGKPDNYTGPSEEAIQFCGLNDCPWNNVTNENFEKPPSAVIWTLVGVYIGISILTLILTSIFVDKLPVAWIPEEEKQKLSLQNMHQTLGATLHHLRYANQLLLIPLTIYSGLEQTFYTTEFYKSYITCNLGMWLIQLLTLPGAVANALSSFTTGRLVKYTGAPLIFIAAMLVDVCLQMTLIFWMPHPDDLHMFILIPILQGLADGVWQTQLNALYGVLFPRETVAAYSNYRLWESSGYIAAFAWSSFLCTSVKFYITISFFYTGSVLLLVVFVRERRARSSKGQQVLEMTKL